MTPIILKGTLLGLGVVRSLGMVNTKSILICSNKGEIARASKHVSKAYKCPPWENYEAVKNFLLNKKEEIRDGMLIPAGDAQVEMLAKYKMELSKHFTIPVPDYEIVKALLDKKCTYEIAKKAGIDFPVTFYPNCQEEALESAKKIKFPFLIKPRERNDFHVATNGKKLFVVNNESELIRKLSFCFEHKLKIMITEIIFGLDTQLFEYTFYVNKTGEMIAGIGHVKLRQTPPTFGVGRVIKTIGNEAVQELARKFLKHIPGFFGPGQIEFKLDSRDQKYKMIEMNCRLTLQNELYAKAGINFPSIYFEEWANNRIPKINNYIENFYWIHLLSDLVCSVFKNNEENYSISDYIRPYLKKHSFGIESLSDPKPMILYWSRRFNELSSTTKKTLEQI